MNNILYLVTGDNPIYREELICSLLSLNHVMQNDNFSVTIYSDHTIDLDQSFKFQVSFITLTKETIDNWLAKSNFLLALKPHVINHFLEMKGGNVLFLDTDTYFIDDPLPLFKAIAAGKLILHLKENSVKGRKDLSQYLIKKYFIDSNNNTFQISLNTTMWNSGVVGINTHNRSIISKIIHLVDQMRIDTKWHTIEQFAFSYFFQQQSLISADQYIAHYWFFKPTRLLLLYYFRTPNESAKAMVVNSIRQNLMPREINFDQLQDTSYRLFLAHQPLYDWHLYSLPKSSIAGKKIRRHLKGIDFWALRIKVWFRNLFHLNRIIEIEKPSYDYIQ